MVKVLIIIVVWYFECIMYRTYCMCVCIPWSWSLFVRTGADKCIQKWRITALSTVQVKWNLISSISFFVYFNLMGWLKKKICRETMTLSYVRNDFNGISNLVEEKNGNFHLLAFERIKIKISTILFWKFCQLSTHLIIRLLLFFAASFLKEIFFSIFYRHKILKYEQYEHVGAYVIVSFAKRQLVFFKLSIWHDCQ